MKRVVWVAIGLIALSIAITLITFTVSEGECALVTQFGRPVRTIENPGLNFKWPVPIQTVNRFDRRLQLFESRLVEFLTKDKKNVVLKFFVLWKLDKPKEFFLSVGNTATAEQKLDDILISKGGASRQAQGQDQLQLRGQLDLPRCGKLQPSCRSRGEFHRIHPG
jgi:membrane protease subunit HflC